MLVLNLDFIFQANFTGHLNLQDIKTLSRIISPTSSTYIPVNFCLDFRQ